MNKIKIGAFVTMLCIVVMLTSAVPGIKHNPNPVTVEESVSKNFTDGNKTVSVNPKEFRKALEVMAGRKLTLKERLALKLFNKKLSNGSGEGGKSQIIALILVVLVGTIGIHRFYLGYTWQGVVQLLTGGGCGVWTLIDLIRIITGDLQPKNGPYDKTL